MERFVRGDSGAFEALYTRHCRGVRNYLARLVGPHPAEDLTQVTFLSVVRAKDRFRSGAAFKPWLFAIATNAARDYVRRKRPDAPTPDGELPFDLAAEEAPGADPELRKRVRLALEALPTAQREAIVLHRFEGFSFSAIAQTLGLSESAVKVRAHRGYVRLRELLAGMREAAS